MQNSAPVEKKRKPTPVFLGQMALVALLMWGVGSYIGSRVSLGIDGQKGGKCLPYNYYLIDKGDHSVPTGGYLAFLLDKRAEPWFPEHAMFVKQLVAAEGDHVQVQGREVLVNGFPVGQLDPKVMGKTGQDERTYARDQVLQPGELWVMGTAPDSFDSRYWGPINSNMLVGQVHPIY